MPSSDLVDAVSRIKADGARRSRADVLAQLRDNPEWAAVTLSQVRSRARPGRRAFLQCLMGARIAAITQGG